MRSCDSAGDYAVPYFRELVEDALAHQHLCARELTAFYIVRLLAGHIRREIREVEEAAAPLALQLSRALQAHGVARRAALRLVGDESLFVSGFFSDSLRRGIVDVDYYIAMGRSAYVALSRLETEAVAPVFAELAAKFPGFVDVLMEVSERSACTSNADLLRLYERWMHTGSARTASVLVERGVFPVKRVRPIRVQ